AEVDDPDQEREHGGGDHGVGDAERLQGSRRGGSERGGHRGNLGCTGGFGYGHPAASFRRAGRHPVRAQPRRRRCRVALASRTTSCAPGRQNMNAPITYTTPPPTIWTTSETRFGTPTAASARPAA